MRAHSFNDDWTVRHLGTDEEAVSVTIPHDAMLSERRLANSAGGSNTGWFEGFDYIYEKIFTLGSEYSDKKIIFEFEGVYHNSEVWINGKQAAFRPYGYTNFHVDPKNLLRIGGENKIEVIARNADQPNSRWYSGAGIYRPVTMWVADQTHIAFHGVKVRTVTVNPAVIEIRVKTEGEGIVRAEISDGGNLVYSRKKESDGEVVFFAEIENAKLWNVGRPYLYTVDIYFGTDHEAVPFGIRTLTWGKEGFYINGERAILHGACIHHDHGLLGACCFADAEERKVRLLMENGYNAVRSAHNPCSKALLDACDRYGMLVMDEYIDHWYIHKTEYDYVNYFMDWWKQDLKDMVEKDYNHPCVIMYSTGNEVAETAQKRGIALTKEMTEYLHNLDSGRPVTCGINIFFNFLSSIGFGVYSDKKAKKKKAAGSKFFNELAGVLGANVMKLGATLHGCDLRTRDAFANMDIAGYNYGILRYHHDLKKYPERLILGSETFCKDAFQFWKMAKRNPRIVGDFVWAGMDYLGEVSIGSWEYKDYAPEFGGGPGWISAGSGRIDLTGKPLCEAAYTKVAFEKEMGPFIGVCPVNHTNDKHSPSAWKMTNALESWSWNGCDGSDANVEVYARAAAVELFINGRKAGRKELTNDCIAHFRCVYEDGVIEAVAYNEQDEEIGRTLLRTASYETVLRAEPEQDTAAAGHLCYIRLKYTDDCGIVKPLEKGSLNVEVCGGKLLGLGNGCPYNMQGYLGNTTDTYFGEAMAIVLAENAENLILKVTDGKLRGETVIPIGKGGSGDDC